VSGGGSKTVVPAPGYSVQVSAVRTPEAAEEVAQRLRRAGFTPHTTQGADGYIKVRVGRYGSRVDAQRAAGEVRSKIGGSPFVVEES